MMKIPKNRVLTVFLVLVFFFGPSVLAQETVQKLGEIDTSFYVPPESTELYANPHAVAAVRNVILLIGDGMGLSETSLAHLVAGGAAGKLHMERLPVTGIVWTYASDELVTDSAAAATALASGVSTPKGVIGLSPEGGRVLTLPEAAKQKGMATGMVVTVSIVDATPAGFAAHVPSRGDKMGIALDLRDSGVDVLLGGGRSYWLPASVPGGKREDGRDLMAELGSQGYGIVRNAEELAAAKGSKLLGLFEDGDLTTRSPEPSLEAMTGKAIETLAKNKAGFFLMVEGSQIDRAGHENDAGKLVRQVLLFDLAVRKALEFAEKDGSTLVIVVSDHETGGLVLKKGQLSGKGMKVSWTTKHHTPTPVMLYAFGPGSPAFAGVQHHVDVSRKIASALGITEFPKVSSGAKTAETAETAAAGPKR